MRVVEYVSPLAYAWKNHNHARPSRRAQPSRWPQLSVSRRCGEVPQGCYHPSVAFQAVAPGTYSCKDEKLAVNNAQNSKVKTKVQAVQRSRYLSRSRSSKNLHVANSFRNDSTLAPSFGLTSRRGSFPSAGLPELGPSTLAKTPSERKSGSESEGKLPPASSSTADGRSREGPRGSGPGRLVEVRSNGSAPDGEGCWFSSKPGDM